MQDDFNISRRKTLAALGTIGAASAGAGLGTSAYFSDQESFENNGLVAGELDLKVSWDEHYSDWMGEETDYARMPEDGETPDLSLPAADPNGRPIELVFSDRTAFMDATRQEQFPEGGLGSEEDPCEALADVGDDDMEAPVITVDDVKPGDFGEVTFDFTACDNPALLWMNGRLVDEAENGLTEPEADDPDEGDTAGGGDDTGGGTGSITSNGPFTVTPDVSAMDLASTLVSPDGNVNITNATYTGAPNANGTFTGGTDPFGIGNGIILSSGSAANLEESAGGADNNLDGISAENGQPGDADLTELAGAGDVSNDAAVLELTFEVPEGEDQIFFNFVFGSDEYNEYAPGGDFDVFGDVFGFFVNPGSGTAEETNVALINGEPVSVESINQITNQALFNNNDPSDTDTPFATEADGFTDVLQVQADVNPGEENTLKLAIADENDQQLDSWVLIGGETLSTEPPTENESELVDKLRARAWYDEDIAGDNVHQDGEEVFLEGSLRDVLDALSTGNGVPLAGNEPAADGGGTGRNCYSEAPDVHYVAFQWWLPIDHGNEVQSDSATFDLGFYTEQCRHNDGSGMNNEGVDPDEVDP
ncbi:choice-of-anchor L domain-containing protein [Haloplanus aerogenes]|uniref:Putative ribosomally synthesized peptide with SipW-like signal peptide n=1 Tax=Haloplanus aerogenes TaxID=660522 RepID=A0A3M0CYR4_9EURY|nr:choice-of-anchor L domain-containing protein [Haloplanus aerogenes]RMB13954.1 putative ribosomally synthesized peptide with SipW-like signal peptide [Haloplanus aerogenes]